MSAINTISADKLARLIGTPRCPVLIDVRPDDDFDASPVLIPGSIRRAHTDASAWGGLCGRSAVVICKNGARLSQGTAAWLRHDGVAADALEHGFDAGSCAAATVGGENAAERPGRTYRLGHACPAEDRPHCLSVAYPALCRSARRVSLRRRVRG